MNDVRRISPDECAARVVPAGAGNPYRPPRCGARVKRALQRGGFAWFPAGARGLPAFSRFRPLKESLPAFRTPNRRRRCPPSMLPAWPVASAAPRNARVRARECAVGPCAGAPCPSPRSGRVARARGEGWLRRVHQAWERPMRSVASGRRKRKSGCAQANGTARALSLGNIPSKPARRAPCL